MDDCYYAGIAAREMSCPLSQTSSSCCSLDGIECENNSIIKLYMNDAGCSGNISTLLGNLMQLRTLYIIFNSRELRANQLTGSIPVEIVNLATLKKLLIHSNSRDLSYNELTGSIPVELEKLSILENL
jgi:hypothetical protein